MYAGERENTKVPGEENIDIGAALAKKAFLHRDRTAAWFENPKWGREGKKKGHAR